MADTKDKTNKTEKIAALGRAGEWDLCSTSQSALAVTDDLVPGTIYNSFGAGGHKMRLFKTLMTNACTFDCKYCENTCKSRKIYAYEPQELADIFKHLYMKRQVDGLFLSSGVAGDPDSSMERMLDAVRIIREHFNGYVHIKALPGASRENIKQACELSDRVSINIEAPNKAHMADLSSNKSYDKDILRRQEWIRELAPSAGQTTQMVIGAGDESDLEILGRAEWEYVNIGAKRVYYSPFQPIPGTALEAQKAASGARQRRLYCVDFMMRQYGIPLKEFKSVMHGGNLPSGDPKVRLALERFDEPLDLADATYEDLIQIPGIGPIAAYCIKYAQENGMSLKQRKQLKQLGVVIRRAEPFLRLDGHSQKRLSDYEK
jgi:predicted DNA-binding helix-hairpin-helix protein